MALSVLFWDTPGTDDVEEAWLPWLRVLTKLGLIAGYTEIGEDYPPGAAALFLVARTLLPDAGERTVLKALCAAAQFSSALVFAAYARRKFTALCYVLAVALSCSALEYLDILYAVPLLVALFAIVDKRPILSVTALSVACLIKWQPLIIAPFLAIIWCRQARSLSWRSLIVTALFLSAGIGAIAWLFWPEVWLAFHRAMATPAVWSGNALNFPWLVQIVLGFPPELLFVGENQRLVFKVGFWSLYLLILVVTAAKHASDTMTVMSFALFGFAAYFLLAPGVHENHLFVPMLASLVLWDRDRSFGWAAMAFASYANLNLWLFYGFSGTSPFYGGPAFAVLTAVLSALAVALFVYLLFQLFIPSLGLRQGWPRHMKRPSSGSSDNGKG